MLWTSTAFAAASANLLGVNYSEWFVAATQMATDTSGALYVLAPCQSSGSVSCVSKLSADGKTLVWQNALGFQTNSMAVSPSGDVFVIPVIQASDTSVYVAKLGASGSGVAWKAAAGFLPPGNVAYVPVLAADSSGRTYLAALSGATPSGTTPSPPTTTVVRINATGGAVDYTAIIIGAPTAIAADGSGAALVAGWVQSSLSCFVARVNPDGSMGYYTSLPQNEQPALALDAKGNAIIWGSTGLNRGLLQRLDATGAVIASTSVPVIFASSVFATGAPPSPLGVDSAGNAYVLGLVSQLTPVRNTIAPCLPTAQAAGLIEGTAPVLTVIGPDGSVPQISYVPGLVYANTTPLLLAVGPNATVFVAAGEGAIPPTRQGPFPQAAPPFATVLAQLAAQSAAPLLPLACVANAANYLLWPVAPGEIVALVGNGLGPTQGVQTQATAQSPFPTQASGVQVTFDGTPAPLLWVQDSQINAVAPWELTPGTNTRICVSYGPTNTNCLTWPVSQTAAGVFTVDGVHAAALNQDGSINSAANPAAPGSIVSVYATGLGPINPPQADGSLVGFPLPSNVLQAGVEAQSIPLLHQVVLTANLAVTFAGPAPYLVAGASQINFQLPTAKSANFPLAGYAVTLPSTIIAQQFNIFMASQ